jgi:hypothetical protein
MSASKVNLKDKKDVPKTFRDAIINDNLRKNHDSPVLRKKVEEAKRF